MPETYTFTRDQLIEALSTPATIGDVVADSIEQQSRFGNALRHPGMEGY